MRIVTVVGARPQFIKASPLGRALREAGCEEFLIHTGQHYDYGMSQVFFDELGMAAPDVNLEVGSGSHGQQTGKMLALIEDVLVAQKPDWMLVYGDTNSTLAGALAAVKLHIPLAHVEAGLRSWNRTMPEEHNRVLTDHCSDLLFCPTQTGVDNLAREGITRGVHLVGDTMYDVVLQGLEMARAHSRVLETLALEPKGYALATVHRPYNTDEPENLRNILRAFEQMEAPVVFPVHPRTRQKIDALEWPEGVFDARNVRFIEPLGYLDMLLLQQNARLILTDSGGVQKEAAFLEVPCVTLRPETEWVETVAAGWNVLAGVTPSEIAAAAKQVLSQPKKAITAFGNGHAARQISDILVTS